MTSQHKVKHIGLFGGTFDPIHNGHIVPIKKAAQQLSLDHIYLMPANIPPHKNSTQTSSFHRSEMTKLVCQQEPLFTFDDRELKRASASYTVDSLAEIRQELCDKNSQTHLYFFMGMDSLNTFTTWYQWQEILSLCHLVVMPRPGYSLDKTLPNILLNNIIDYTHSQQKINTPGQNQLATGNIFLMHDMCTDISSTKIRTLLNTQTSHKHDKSNQQLLTMLPNSIYQYICTHQLY